MQALVVPQASKKTLAGLRWQEVAVPQPAAREVLIAVQAVGLNPIDVKLVKAGNPAWQYPHVLGLDVAGVIVAVGAGVVAFAVGDRVCGHGDLTRQGGFAEYAVMAEATLAKIPPAIDFATAAGSLCAGLTAYQSLMYKANLQAAETILIHAGAGGVGSMAIQLAQQAGLKVATTVSAAKRDFVMALKPDCVIDYQREAVDTSIARWTAGTGVDIVLNTIGRAEADYPRLSYNGQLLCVRELPKASSAPAAITVADINLGGAYRSHNQRQVQLLGRMTRELLVLVAEQRVDPFVNPITFQDIPRGLTALEQGIVTGKWVAVV